METAKTIEKIIELAAAFGWNELPSKNPYMISFIHGDFPNHRINVYFTKMTVQVQRLDLDRSGGAIYKDVTMAKLEEIFEQFAEQE